jgi:hypothetical protein
VTEKPARIRTVQTLPPRARFFFAYLMVGGVLLMGLPGPDVFWIGFVFAALSAVGWAWTLPRTWDPVPRRRLSDRLAFSKWTRRRVGLTAAAVLMIVVSPFLARMLLPDDDSRFVRAVFVGVGLASAWGAASQDARAWTRRREAARAAAATHADEPWTWDADWPRGGAKRPFARRLLRRGPFLGLASLALFAQLVRAQPDQYTLSLEFVLGGVAAFPAGPAWKIVGMGVAFLDWPRFPLFVGERAEMTFGVSEGGADLTDVQITLRRLRESRDEAGPDATAPFCEQTLHEAEPPPESTLPAGVHRRVVFDVPADAPGTTILSARVLYWEVRVQALADGRPYEELFLVPLYARPRQRKDVSNAPSPAGTTSVSVRSSLPGTATTSE